MKLTLTTAILCGVLLSLLGMINPTSSVANPNGGEEFRTAASYGEARHALSSRALSLYTDSSSGNAAGAPSGASVVLAPAWADPDHDARVSILDIANMAQYFGMTADASCQTWNPQPVTLYDASGTPVSVDAGFYSGDGEWAAAIRDGTPVDVRVCP